MTPLGDLLRRADDVVRFFDEILGPKPISGDLPKVESLVQQIDSFCSGGGLPSSVTLLSITPPERCDVVTRWSSRDAMCVAVCRTMERERLSPPEPGSLFISLLQAELKRPNVALETYVSFLERREHLLDPCSIDELVRGVARDSLSPDVTKCAVSLGESLTRLSHRDMNTREQWQEHRDSHVIPAAQSLRTAALLPAAATATVGVSGAVPAAVDVSSADPAVKKAREIAPRWPEWSDKHQQECYGRPKTEVFWASESDGILPTPHEHDCLLKAIDALRQRVNRALKKK